MYSTSLPVSKLAVRRNLFLALIALAFMPSCTSSSTYPPVDPNEIKEVDLAFSKMSEEQGIPAAFLHYADSNVVMFRNGNHPTMGWLALKERYESRTLKSTLTWAPDFAEIAESGELGYTWGIYTLTTFDSLDQPDVKNGYYISVWKKQANGDWKFVFDGGTTPYE